MLLSIIGNILGSDGKDATGSSGGGDDALGGELAGSMSEDELLPGSSSGSDTDGGDEMELGGEVSGDGGMDGGMDEDIFGDDGGGGDDFLEDDAEMGGEMSIDGMDGGDDSVSSEIEARVEEMENDVGSLSSTVNTVQSENEQISESLEDIEENIRKLLEVYEMVTQGVNPFVEDDSLNDTFGGGAAGSGDFGGQSLFDTDDDAEEDEEMGDEIAEADAEEFLDESIIDDDEEMEEFGMEEGGDDLAAEGGDEFAVDEADDDLGMGSDDLADEDDGAAGGDDLSFDDLKSEYESGDADWSEGETADDETEITDGTDDGETGDGPAEDDAEFAELEAEDEQSAAEDDDTFAELEDGPSEPSLPDGEATAAPTDEGTVPDAAATAADEEATIPWDDGGRPYLESVPAEYDTEFVVMDWLDYLVGEAGLDGAAETVRFYGSIYWISESVEEYLQTILNGFHGGPDVEDPEPRSGLGVDHTRSLWRVTQISTPKKKRLSYAEWLERETDSVHAEADDTGADVAGEELTYTEAAANDAGDASVSGVGEGAGDGGVGEGAGDGVAETSLPTDASVDVATADTVGNGDEAETGSAPREGVADGDQTLSEGDAHKIVIDESSDDHRGDDQVPVDDGSELPEPKVNANGGQMIWVDSDVVLSESGVELQQTRAEYDRSEQSGRVQPFIERTDEPDEVDIKPLVVSDDHSDLEPWQIDLIRSLFAPETTDGYGR